MLIGLTHQVFAVIGVGNADQCQCAFGYRFAFEVDHAVLGDHIHHVGARGGHDVAVGQRQHDAAFSLPFFFIGG